MTCFNQRVFILVADKLEGHGGYQRFQCYAQFILQPLYTDNFQNSYEKTLQMHFKVAERNFYVFIVQAGDSLTDALRVVIVLWLKDELGSCPLGCLMQLVLNTKANLSCNYTLSPVCLQPG